jgi:transposase
VIFQAALVAVHLNPTMKTFADRLRKAGKPHKFITMAGAWNRVNLSHTLCESRQKWTPSTV